MFSTSQISLFSTLEDRMGLFENGNFGTALSSFNFQVLHLLDVAPVYVVLCAGGVVQVAKAPA
jgi:hypothetical protein